MTTISFNPAQTIVPPSSFLAETQGFTQGISLADPASRMWLLSGTVSQSAATPIWGGIPIVEDVTAPGAYNVGSTISPAASGDTIGGFATFDSAYSMLIVPGNSVAIAGAGQSCAYYRFGSNRLIPVPCSAALITAVESNPASTAVKWNFSTGQLDTTGTAISVIVHALDTNSKIVSYDSSTGAVTWSTGSVAVIKL